MGWGEVLYTHGCGEKTKWVAILVAVGIYASIFMTLGILRAGDQTIVEGTDGEVCLSWVGPHLIRVKKKEYRVQRWGPDRLRLRGLRDPHGVFLKRLGVHLVIRGLSGNILHIVQKGGMGYRIQTPVGQDLFFIESASHKVRVLGPGGDCLFIVSPDHKGVVIRDAKGRQLYTVKGKVGTLAVSFLCIPSLSWPERAGCFLLYADRPSP